MARLEDELSAPGLSQAMMFAVNPRLVNPAPCIQTFHGALNLDFPNPQSSHRSRKSSQWLAPAGDAR